MSKYKEKFHAGKFYHVYNRAIGSERLFFDESNYYYFFSVYKKLLSQLVESYSYCLIPNHFHLLIRIPDGLKDAEEVVKEGFRKCFISYAQAINIQENRRGSLFMRPFKRKVIEEDSYLTRIITYLHRNPFSHGLINNFADYKWSSYQPILSDLPTLLKRREVLEWFGGTEEFIKAHQRPDDKEDLSRFLFE